MSYDMKLKARNSVDDSDLVHDNSVRSQNVPFAGLFHDLHLTRSEGQPNQAGINIIVEKKLV